MKSVQIVLEDEVDHAGDGIRSVDRRSPTRDDIDPFDEGGRNRVHIDFRDLAGVAGDPAPAVHQHQCAHAAEPPQIQRRAAAARIVGRVRKSRDDLREAVQRLLDIGDAGQAEALGVDRLSRAGADQVRRRDTRAGDDQRLLVTGRFLALGSGRGG
jgi:hypothetical protein